MKKSKKKDTKNIGNDNGVLPKGTIVWKACRRDDDNFGGILILKLQVLEDGVVPYAARVSTCFDGARKCRVPAVKVLSMHTKKSGTRRAGVRTARSDHDPSFVYEVGKVVRSRKWDPSMHFSCTYGIHCFRTRAEAERWL